MRNCQLEYAYHSSDKSSRTAPEVSWKAFSADNGQGYLDILFKLSREHPPKEYVYFHHSLVDTCMGIKEPWSTLHSYDIQDVSRFLQREYVASHD